MDIEVEPFGEFYREVNNGFVIEMKNNGDLLVLGVQEKGKEEMRPLNAQECAKAKSLELKVSEKALDVSTVDKKESKMTSIPDIILPILPKFETNPKMQSSKMPSDSKKPVYHPKSAVESDEDNRKRVLKYLEENTGMLDTLIELADFERRMHDIYDTGRPCYRGEDGDQCDNCYSGDTEFEHKENMRDFLSSISRVLKPYDSDNDDAEDDE